MKRISRSSLWVMGLTMLVSCWTVAPVTLSLPLLTAQIPHSGTDYQQSMQSGYDAAAKQNYGKALEHFKRALKLRPGDRNAQVAINNINHYQTSENGFHVTPSGVGAPSVRERGATRQKNCLDGRELVAIIPKNQLGLTSLAHPTLLFYIPPTSAKSLRVRLEDSNGAILYKKTLKTPTKTRLAEFNFAEFNDSPSLKTKTTYRWAFTLHCDPQDTSADVTVSGMIRRIELDPVLLRQLETVSISDRAMLYAINGLWYDAVKALINARQSTPTDDTLAKYWLELLKSVDLNEKLGSLQQ